jgi:hypothetical protein
MKRYHCITHFVFAGVIAVLIFSCSQRTNPISSPIPGQEFLPSIPGTWWKYDAFRYVNDLSDSTIHSEITIRVLEYDSLSGAQRVSKWQINCPDPLLAGYLFLNIPDSIAYVRETLDSVTLYNSLHDTIHSVFLLLPLRLDRTWSEGGPPNGWTTSVDSIVTVTVGAGTFTDTYLVDAFGGWWQAPTERFTYVKQSIGVVQLTARTDGLIFRKFVLKLKAYYFPA